MAMKGSPQWQGLKTDMAGKFRIDAGSGATEEVARTRLKANYLYAAGKITNAEWFKTTSG